MNVRFTTTAPAGSGRTYVATLFTKTQACNQELGSEQFVEGAVDATYQVTIIATQFFEDETFCAGPAELLVWTENIDGAPEHGPPLRRLQLRILPPQAG